MKIKQTIENLLVLLLFELVVVCLLIVGNLAFIVYIYGYHDAVRRIIEIIGIISGAK